MDTELFPCAEFCLHVFCPDEHLWRREALEQCVCLHECQRHKSPPTQPTHLTQLDNTVRDTVLQLGQARLLLQHAPIPLLRRCRHLPSALPRLTKPTSSYSSRSIFQETSYTSRFVPAEMTYGVRSGRHASGRPSSPCSAAHSLPSAMTCANVCSRRGTLYSLNRAVAPSSVCSRIACDVCCHTADMVSGIASARRG